MSGRRMLLVSPAKLVVEIMMNEGAVGRKKVVTA
jgi:hypothetical protein